MIYLIISFLSNFINLFFSTIFSMVWTDIIFLPSSSIFNNLKIFLNWINVWLSKESYSSYAFCLYLFNTNLFIVPSVLVNRDILVNKFPSLFSFISLSLSSWLLLSSSSLLSKSCKPFLAPSASTLSFALYFINACHNSSFSSSEFHKSYNPISFKKSSKFSYESNSLLFAEK